MTPIYYAVAPKGQEWKWATMFYRTEHATFTFPTVIEGAIDIRRFKFKNLTEAEYETYLETGALEYRGSDTLAITANDYKNKEYEDAQAAFEFKELDDVFNQS